MLNSVPVQSILTGVKLINAGRQQQKKWVGTWRSLVAHLNGVQGAGGSNPLVPTSYFKGLAFMVNPFFC